MRKPLQVKRGFRLTRSADITKVRRHGKRIGQTYFLLVSHPNDQKGLRIAVTAGRAVGGAVQRNRAKRVLRAAIQPLTGLIKPDWDIVLVAKPAVSTIKSTEIKDAIHAILKRANLLR